MKNLKTLLTITAGACALASSTFASMVIATSYVGDIGNSADTNGYGAVNYGYRVGTHEVTNSQYVSFLNAKGSLNAHGVFNASMESDNSHGGIQRDGTIGSFSYSVKAGMGNQAVNYVSFWDAARFTNWLTNGQGSGSTETGVYTLGYVTNPTNNTVTRNTGAWAAGGVAIANDDEWYKAAYYQPVGDGGDTDSYWLYATASNSITTAEANYNSSDGTVKDVGTYSAYASYYGTFDQSGNVWEWNEAIDRSGRALRGGAFGSGDSSLHPSVLFSYLPTLELNDIGFRVSSLTSIPEPSTYAAIFGYLALTVATMRRKGRRTL